MKYHIMQHYIRKETIPMSKIMIISSDSILIKKIEKIIKLHFSKTEITIHPNERQALARCMQNHPDLILLDTDMIERNEVNDTLDRLYHLNNYSEVFLFTDETDSAYVCTLMQKRNERILLKPINELKLLDCLSSCLNLIDMIHSRDETIKKLNQVITQFRPQVEYVIIQDIATNASPQRITDNLSLLGYTFTEGVIALVSSNETPKVKEQVYQMFSDYGYNIVQSDFYDYTIYLIMAVQFFKFDDLKELEYKIYDLNNERFFIGAGNFKRNIAKMNECYKEAVDYILQGSLQLGSSLFQTILNDEMKHRVSYHQRMVLAYFLMMNESHIKHHLYSAASIIIQHSSEIVCQLTDDYFNQLAALFAYSFKCQNYFSIHTTQDFKSAEEIYEYTLDLYHQISMPYMEMRNDPTHYKLRHILYYVLNHHTDSRLSLADVSRDLNISEYYICKLLRNFTNFTFVEFLNLLRVEHAKKLLESNHTIKQISREVGFSSSTYLGRIFRKYTSTSPSEYRARFTPPTKGTVQK